MFGRCYHFTQLKSFLVLPHRTAIVIPAGSCLAGRYTTGTGTKYDN